MKDHGPVTGNRVALTFLDLRVLLGTSGKEERDHKGRGMAL